MAALGGTGAVARRPVEGGPSQDAVRDSATPEGRSTRSRWNLSSGRDDRLAARAAKGDRHAFGELYSRHHQPIYRFSLSRVGDPEDAADVLQTTMAKALSALERGEVVTGVRPWLFRIAHNASIDLIRSRRPRAPLEEAEEIDASPLTMPSAESEAQSRAELAEVVADIRRLPERQASALVMRELSELSYAEIGTVLATSPLAARQLVHQARSLLHDNRNGRDMDCETVRQELGDSDGRRPRDRRVRAHLAACAGCTAFRQSIRVRRSALAALAPSLAPVAAGEILGRLLDSGSTAGTSVAGGLGAGIGKLAGASGVAKLVGTAAAGTAVVAAVGGAVMAGGALLGPDDVASTVRSPNAAEAILRPDLPGLRMPGPIARAGADRAGGDRSGRGGEDGRGRGRDTGSPPGPGGPSSPGGPSGAGLPIAGLGERTDLPVDLGPVDPPSASGPLRRARRVAAKVPAAPVELPDAPRELPDAPRDLPDAPVDVPEGSTGTGRSPVGLPDGSDGSSGSIEVGVPEVEIPEVEVPRPTVPPPSAPTPDSVGAPTSSSPPELDSAPSGARASSAPDLGAGLSGAASRAPSAQFAISRAPGF